MLAMINKYIYISDTFLLNIFNNRIKCRLLDFMMPLITYIGSAIFSVLICLSMLIYPSSISKSASIKTSLSLILSGILVRFIKITVNRMRPFLRIDNLNLNKIQIDKYSFPSGHTTAAFSIGITLALCFSSFSLLFIIMATLVGISRMYLGVHYPTDVLCGMLLGTISSLFIFFVI
jgi:Membrane-associated phospholipid phosphatase